MSAISQNKAEAKSNISVQSIEKEMPPGEAVEFPKTLVSEAISSAPLTFDPSNTNDCPSMFADKWLAEP